MDVGTLNNHDLCKKSLEKRFIFSIFMPNKRGIPDGFIFPLECIEG